MPLACRDILLRASAIANPTHVAHIACPSNRIVLKYDDV